MALHLSSLYGQILKQTAVSSWCGLNLINRCGDQVSHYSTPKRITAKTAMDRSLTPYMFYFQEELKRLRENEPGRRPTEYTVAVANSWKNLTSEEKKAYEERSALDAELKKQRYDQLTEDEKAQLVADKQMKLDKRYKAAVKKMFRDCGKPLRPVTAKSFFLRDLVSKNEFPKIGKGSSQLIRDKFNSLSSEEKERFEIMAEEDKGRYEREMVQWVAKIKSEGKEHFVSKALMKKYLPPQ